MSQQLKLYVLSLSASATLRVETEAAVMYSHEPTLAQACDLSAAEEAGLIEAHRRWPEAEGWQNHSCSAVEVTAHCLMFAAQYQVPAVAPALFDPVALLGYAVEQIEMASRAAALFRSASLPSVAAP